MTVYRIYVDKKYYGKTPIKEQAIDIVRELRKKGKYVVAKIEDGFGTLWVDATI